MFLNIRGIIAAIHYMEVTMKSANNAKAAKAGNTAKVPGTAQSKGLINHKISNEDKEFFRRMNAFTQEAGLLSDDPFYRVL